MKAKILIVLMFSIIIGVNANAKECCRIKKETTPWQTVLKVLSAHGVDTIGMDVTSLVSTSVLRECSTDLAKSFKVKEPINWNNSNDMIGSVVCIYMKKKYNKKSSEENEYYKIRYSPFEDDYEEFLEQYPESKYAQELMLKHSCLKAFWSWLCLNETDSACHIAYQLSKKAGICDYEGFSKLSRTNKEYMKTVEDWDNLMLRRAQSGYGDCGSFEDFAKTHKGHLSGYNFFIQDSINQCWERNAWKTAQREKTISYYRKYLAEYPNGLYSTQATNKVTDYDDFIKAKSAGTHSSFAAYCDAHPDGDSINAAKWSLKKIEDPDWKRVENTVSNAKRKNASASIRTKALREVDDYIDKYPNGYYTSRAAEIQHDMIEAIQGQSISDSTFDIYGQCSSPYHGVVFLGNVSKNKSVNIVFTLRNVETGKVYRHIVKQGDYWRCQLPNGEYNMVACCNGAQDYVGKFTVSGRLYLCKLYLEERRGVTIGGRTITMPSMGMFEIDVKASEKIDNDFIMFWAKEDTESHIKQ